MKSVQKGIFEKSNFYETQTFTIPIVQIEINKAVLIIVKSLESFCTIQKMSLEEENIRIIAEPGKSTSYNDLVVSWQVIEFN